MKSGKDFESLSCILKSKHLQPEARPFALKGKLVNKLGCRTGLHVMCQNMAMDFAFYRPLSRAGIHDMLWIHRR